jgi:ADP-ribose pyrophosphatase YjhB (NUDIX family)
MAAWADPSALACVIPGGSMPLEVNGIAFAPWAQAPETVAKWEALAAKQRIDELEFVAPAGCKPAAGAVIREMDGRVWLVAPSNAYGGYQVTFPKGGLEGKSAQATALVETFEECGLQVRLIQHLIDVRRSTSFTRYYLAERVGGHPADMGWESQAVMLSPASQLQAVLNNPHDAAIVDLLMASR